MPLVCPTDVQKFAGRLALDLPEEQRAAVAVELILTITDPEAFAMIRAAARMVGKHGERLAEAFHAVEPGIEQVAIAPLTDLSAIVTPAARGTAGQPRSRRASPPRAAWASIRAAEARLADSLWGDALACICMLISMFGICAIMWGFS